jgi:hypothetical protein
MGCYEEYHESQLLAVSIHACMICLYHGMTAGRLRFCDRPFPSPSLSCCVGDCDWVPYHVLPPWLIGRPSIVVHVVGYFAGIATIADPERVIFSESDSCCGGEE